MEFLNDIFNSEMVGVFENSFAISPETVYDSVEGACDFFHIDNPSAICEDVATGVYPLNTDVMSDDVVAFNPTQLADMGITGKDGLDLVMTHEGTHRVLQGMDTGFDLHQEELCCDYMAGVRAGLNDIDVSQLKDSLIDTPNSITHPDGLSRVDAIDAGMDFAKDYYYEHGEAPTFDECLNDFKENMIADYDETEQITLREDDNVSFKGYTQSEIDRHVSEAKSDMAHAESNMRHNASIASSKARMGEPHDFENSQLKNAQRDYNEAKAEYQKWSRMKAEENV